MSTQLAGYRGTEVKLKPGPRWAFAVGLLAGTSAAIVGVRISSLASYALPSMALMVAALLLAFIRFGVADIVKIRLGIIDLAFLVFILTRTLIEYYNAGDLGHPAYSGVVLDPLFYYFAFIIARQVGFTKENVIAFIRGIALPAVFVSLIAVFQVLGVAAISNFILNNVSAAGYDRRFELGYQIRGTGTIGHHTELGGYLTCIVAAVCIDLLLSRKGRKLAVYPLVVLPFLIVGEVTTLTFATIGAMAVVLLVTIFKLGVRPIFVIGIGVGATIASFVFGSSFGTRIDDQQIVKSDQFSWLPSTVAFRAEVWVNETFPAIAHRPWTGWGADVYAASTKGWPVFPTELAWISPESEYMRTLITGGILLLIAEIFLFIAILVALVKSARTIGFTTVLPALTMFGVLLVISSIHNHFTSPGAPFPMWMVIGLVVGLGNAKRLEAEDPAPESFAQRAYKPQL